MSEELARAVGRVETKVDALHADVKGIKRALEPIQSTQIRHDAIITTLIAVLTVLGIIAGIMALV